MHGFEDAGYVVHFTFAQFTRRATVSVTLRTGQEVTLSRRGKGQDSELRLRLREAAKEFIPKSPFASHAPDPANGISGGFFVRITHDGVKGQL